MRDEMNALQKARERTRRRQRTKEAQKWTAVVETHRSGRPTGWTFAVEGDPFDPAHEDHWQWKMGNWSLGPSFPTREEAEDAAAALVAFDKDDWAQWAD